MQILALVGLLHFLEDASVIVGAASLLGAEQQKGFARTVRGGYEDVAGDGAIHLGGSFAD